MDDCPNWDDLAAGCFNTLSSRSPRSKHGIWDRSHCHVPGGGYGATAARPTDHHESYRASANCSAAGALPGPNAVRDAVCNDGTSAGHARNTRLGRKVWPSRKGRGGWTEGRDGTGEACCNG